MAKEVIPTEVAIEASQFANRADLEKYVSSKYNLDTVVKDVSIVGTKEELKKLQLSQGSLYWGIRCKDKNYTQKKTEVNKIDRGVKSSFGVNGDVQDSVRITKKKKK